MSIGREGHTSLLLYDGSVVVMGGVGNVYRSDVWKSTDQGASWVQLTSYAGWGGKHLVLRNVNQQQIYQVLRVVETVCPLVCGVPSYGL